MSTTAQTTQETTVQEVRRYSIVRDASFSQAELEAMSLTDLATLFNEEAYETCRNPETFKAISKFVDKKNAIRRIWAVLTEVTDEDETEQSSLEETTQEASAHSSANDATDPREQKVTCASCGLVAAKRTMDSVGNKWYCSDEDACEERITNGGKAIIKAAKNVVKKEKVAKPITASSRNKYSDNDRIKVLVAENPKRKGTASYDRFEQYYSISTVADALRDGITRADLIWDVKHGFISIDSQKEV